MNALTIRTLRPLYLRPSPLRHFSTSITRRKGPQYQPPTPPSSPEPSSNAHRDFYKSFGRPTAKVFLMAWATYQFLYWSWSKLEFMEEQDAKQDELKRLQLELDAAVKEREREKVSVAAASGAGVSPVDPLADAAKSNKSRSWWRFF